MSADFGLSAMTGILPVTMMAGVNVAVIERLFPRVGAGSGGRRKRATRRSTRRSGRGLSGNFSNVGF